MKKFRQAPLLVHILVKNKGGQRVALNQDGINIGTISGGIVNFGGAVYIAPISVTKSITGSGEGNQGTDVSTKTVSNSSNQNSVMSLIDLIRRSIE